MWDVNSGLIRWEEGACLRLCFSMLVVDREAVELWELR